MLFSYRTTNTIIDELNSIFIQLYGNSIVLSITEIIQSSKLRECKVACSPQLRIRTCPSDTVNNHNPEFLFYNEQSTPYLAQWHQAVYCIKLAIEAKFSTIEATEESTGNSLTPPCRFSKTIFPRFFGRNSCFFPNSTQRLKINTQNFKLLIAFHNRTIYNYCVTDSKFLLS